MVIKKETEHIRTGFITALSKRVDLWLVGAMILLIAFSCLMIFSAAYKSTDEVNVAYYARQGSFALVGFLVIIFLMGVDYRLLEEYAWLIYIISIFLLILVLFLGKYVHGARSWFSIGNFTLQPSEFAKIALVIILCRYIDRLLLRRDLKEFSSLVAPFVLTLIPMVLIILQPDLGSMFMFFPVLLGILYLGNIGMSYILSFLGFSCLALGVPLFLTYAGQKQIQHGMVTEFFAKALGYFPYTLVMMVVIVMVFYFAYYFLVRLKFNISVKYFFVTSTVFISGILASYPLQLFLKQYQKQRLIAFINPNIDPFGTGYHIIQSQVAIGSGGFLGKGFLKGTQGQLGFLPVQHTDFIFSVIAEEFGLIGATILSVLFLVILLRGIRIAVTARDRFGSLLAGGIVWLLFVEIIINLGMTMGLMPVMGVSLPFTSYGGSSLLSSMAAVGILLSIYGRRYTH